MSELPVLVPEDCFAQNRERRLACVVAADTSGSMQGEPIAQLARGLVVLGEELRRDALASVRVEVAVVTFDSEVRVVQPFRAPPDLRPLELSAQGCTRTGAGLDRALDLLEERQLSYRAAGLDYYRPWMFAITDGRPQGEADEVLARASARVRLLEQQRRLSFFAIGVEGADFDLLAKVSVRAPLRLRELSFAEFFHWVSVNAIERAHSSPTQRFDMRREAAAKCFEDA